MNEFGGREGFFLFFVRPPRIIINPPATSASQPKRSVGRREHNMIPDDAGRAAGYDNDGTEMASVHLTAAEGRARKRTT